MKYVSYIICLFGEEFEYTIRIRKSEDRKHNDQTKRGKQRSTQLEIEQQEPH